MTLNGAHGEGGSALLRTALMMAALTAQTVRVHNIRGATRKPGLTSEDLTYVRALEAITQAELTGDFLRSEDMTFRPKRLPRAIHQTFSLNEHEEGTIPGSALVVLSSLLPALARAGAYSRVVVTGETYNQNSLTYDVFDRQTLAAMRALGVFASPELVWAGFGYGSRGEVALEVEPSALRGVDWSKRGAMRRETALFAVSELPEAMVERGVAHLQNLFTRMDRPIEVEIVSVRARTPGVFLSILGEAEHGYGCGTALGARGVRIEHVVQSALEPYLDWYRSGAATDPFLIDQLLVLAALAETPSQITTSRITSRLITMVWVIKQFLPIMITLLGREGEPGIVKVARAV